MARAVATVSEARKYVAEQMAGLNRFRMVPGSRSNLFLTEILDPGLDSTAVFMGLLERGVIVKDGKDFEGLGSRYLRVDLNLRKHMDRFLAALRDLETGAAREETTQLGFVVTRCASTA